MLKKPVLTLSFLFLSLYLMAQQAVIKGTVIDKDTRQGLSGATVRLTGMPDTTTQYNTVTGKSGEFSFSDIKSLKYRLEITYSGFEKVNTLIEFKNTTLDLGEQSMVRQAKTLGDVTIVSKAPPVKVKNDTTEFAASQFKVNPDANSEDLVKKMPGVTVENGVVKAGGEQVQKVTVDGRDFFGDDAVATLRNLPAEIVDKIQVFDRLSEQAQLTGIDDGNASKSINIVTKTNMRNGQFGRLFAGYGTDNHYLVGGNMSFFKKNMRLSLVALTNDVNQQNFTEMDLLGVTSSSNRGGFRGGGGGGRGGGGNFGGGGGGFLVGQQPGVSRTNSFGLNYNNLWGKNLEVSGSYFFNNRNLGNQEQLSREYILSGDSSQFYDQNTTSTSTNYNHRANMRINWKLDSFNSILFTPSVNFQRYSSASDVTGVNFQDDMSKISETKNSSRSVRDALNFNNNILYRHSFRKRGRTLSVNLSTGVNNSVGETYTDAFSLYYKGNINLNDSLQQFTDQDTKGLTLSANISYSEPIGKAGILQFSYNPSYTLNKSNREAYLLEGSTGKYSEFDTLLSNVFENTYVTHRTGVSYRLGDQNKNISFGLDYQDARLKSNQTFPYVATVNRPFTNLLPNAMIRYNFTKSSNIRVFYRSSTNPPSVTQLQEVINNSNPLQVSTGNPNLKQQFSHRLGSRYQYTNTKKGTSFFVNVFGTMTNDYVASATYIAQSDSVLNSSVTLYRGSQLSKPVNLDGQWNMNTFVTWGMPLTFIKTTMNINAGLTYNKTPGLINNVSNTSRSTTYTTGVTFASNISQYVDFTLLYNAAFSNVKNSVQSSANNKYISQSAGLRLNLLTKKGWLLNNDLNNQNYSGLTDGFNQNYWLWNMAVAKKFLKNQKAELRLSVFDLLNQNQSITRTVTETYIEDVNTQVLQQYFMLTFTLNLKNFGKPATNNNRQMGGGFERGGFGPPPGGGGPGM